MKTPRLLDWHLSDPRSDHRRGKRAASERFLGIPVRGRQIRSVKVAPELFANLVGVGVSEKRSGRLPCGVPAITFYVQHKLPRSRLTRRLMLPRTLDGLTCDVVACGQVRPAAGGLPSDPLDPLLPGAQISVAGAAAGTLGAFVKDADGDTCLISNCHVLSSDLVTSDQPVFQPATGRQGSRRVGKVKTVIPINADGRNTVDVALAKLDPGVKFDPAIPNFGPITGSGAPSHSDRVVKYGQATWDTTGRFDSIDTDIVVPYDFMSASFTNIQVYRPGSFADSGDSGSLVLEESSTKALGLIFATSSLLTFVIPADAIESALPGLTWL